MTFPKLKSKGKGESTNSGNNTSNGRITGNSNAHGNGNGNGNAEITRNHTSAGNHTSNSKRTNTSNPATRPQTLDGDVDLSFINKALKPSCAGPRRCSATVSLGTDMHEAEPSEPPASDPEALIAHLRKQNDTSTALIKFLHKYIDELREEGERCLVHAEDFKSGMQSMLDTIIEASKRGRELHEYCRGLQANERARVERKMAKEERRRGSLWWGLVRAATRQKQNDAVGNDNGDGDRRRAPTGRQLVNAYWETAGVQRVHGRELDQLVRLTDEHLDELKASVNHLSQEMKRWKCLQRLPEARMINLARPSSDLSYRRTTVDF